MRRAIVLSLVPFALTACPRSKVTPSDAGVVPSASATASATPATTETAPTVQLPARTDVPASVKVLEDLVIEGVLGSPEERNRPDETACQMPLILDKPLRVLDAKGSVAKDGRGLKGHPTIGNARRVCLWAWLGEAGTIEKELIPWGSHLTLRGHLSTPMVGSNPSALMLFDAELISATPPSAPAPPGELPEGDTIGFIRAYDAQSGVAQVDIAFLYFGEAAKKIAAEHGDTVPSGQDWYLLNESKQLRSWPLGTAGGSKTWPRFQNPDLHDGWQSVKNEQLVGNRPYLFSKMNGGPLEVRQTRFWRREK